MDYIIAAVELGAQRCELRLALRHCDRAEVQRCLDAGNVLDLLLDVLLGRSDDRQAPVDAVRQACQQVVSAPPFLACTFRCREA